MFAQNQENGTNAMQQFQFKQHKLKHADQANQLREQLADLKNENKFLRCVFKSTD